MSGSGLTDHRSSRDLGFNLKQRTLSVSGRRVLLDARSAVVFHTLAESYGELVSKDVLLATAWPDQIVNENSLAKCISRLRAALVGSGLVITAAYGLGYTLRELDRGPADENESERLEASTQADIRSGTPLRRRIGLPLLVLILITTAVAILAVNRSRPEVGLRTNAPATNDAADAIATMLWVDDHPSNNELEVEYFRRRKIAVHLAEDTEDALKLLRMNDYQLVLSDLGRGEDRLAGLKLIQIMKQQGIRVPAIIYTMRPNDPARRSAQQIMVAEAGAVDLALTPAEVRSKVINRFAAESSSDPMK
jgi:DNA-binding response OmpR family regulator